MNECYLCRRPLENFIDETTANHEEHIIPQAIGGQLTAKDILCKECGGEKYLGGQIDKPFSNMFLLITERLDIKRDRKTRPVALTGKLKLFNGDRVLDVNLRENILANRRPEYTVDHVKKSVRIFANKAIAKDYKRKVEREVRENIENSSDYTFTVVSDLYSHEDFAGVLELPFNIDNKTFEAGFAKIAIEFALSKGIGRSVVDHLIDTRNRTIISEGTLLPYYPIFKVEEIIEYLRTSVDESFMSHSLVLFSQRQIHEDGSEVKQLYCFVELFGTFQYFIRLNDNYSGDNIDPITYSQRVIKSTGTRVEIVGLSPKDVSIYMSELGMSHDDIADKGDEEARRMIENAYNSRNRYVFDYTDNIKRIVDTILRDSMIQSNESITKMIPDIVYHFYRNPDEDDFHINLFRSRYRKGNFVYSIIPEIIDLYEVDRDKFREYTHFKFTELEAFINENNTRFKF